MQKSKRVRRPRTLAEAAPDVEQASLPPIAPEQIKKVVENIKGKVPTDRRIVRREGGVLTTETAALRIRTQPIMWGIPGDELMFFKFFSRFLLVNQMPWDSYSTTESTYLPNARNDIHDAFLGSHPDWKFLAMVDSDVLYPPYAFDHLMDLSIKNPNALVGGWYHKKGLEQVGRKLIAVPTVYREGSAKEKDGAVYFRRYDYRGKGIKRVGAIGMGCIVMSRKIAEALGSRPYNMHSGGEDMVICKKITDLGFDILVDWELACPHVGVSYI